MPKQQYSTPILSADIENQIADSIEQFQHRQRWKDWGMDKVREQGAAILLYGPPGCGKSITAIYIAKKLHLAILNVNISEYGSHIPGELARNIKNLFGNALIRATQQSKPCPLVFLDECEACLPSRKKLDAHSLWMLEPITALLKEVGEYPGLVVLATNLEIFLDEAVERRLLSKIHIDKPARTERKLIWLAKIPDKFPVKLTDEAAEELSQYDMTGAEIESALILWVGKQLRNNVNLPDFSTLILDVKQKYHKDE